MNSLPHSMTPARRERIPLPTLQQRRREEEARARPPFAGARS